MTDLPEGVRISYRVGSPEGWSDVRLFDASPRRDQGFRFTHLGDHGTRVASRRNTAAILARRPEFHLIAGDSYANGWQPGWDRWANEIAVLTGSLPLVTSPGNYEVKDFFGATYRARFSHANPGHNWFRFDHLNVHILSVTAGAVLAGQDSQTAIDIVYDEPTPSRTTATPGPASSTSRHPATSRNACQRSPTGSSSGAPATPTAEQFDSVQTMS
jgi:hypothetical protein